MAIELEIDVREPGLDADELVRLQDGLGAQLMSMTIAQRKTAGGLETERVSMVVGNRWAVGYVAVSADDWKRGRPGRRVRAWMDGTAIELGKLGDAEQRRQWRGFPLRVALAEFLNARDAKASRRVLHAHPELISPQSDALLEEFVASARQGGDSPAVTVFESHRALLRRCGEVGIDAAFKEMV
jgi:hypothetical protein